MTGRAQEIANLRCPDCPAVLPTRQGWQRHRQVKHGWVPETKVCTRCQRELPVGSFGPISTRNTRPRSECRECRNRPSAMTPAQQRRDRKAQARRTYGISGDEYELAVEYLTRKQEGRCAICRDATDDLLLDHCHGTGRLRGLLCRTCNAGLGMFRDRPDLLHAAADYLGEWFPSGS